MPFHDADPITQTAPNKTMKTFMVVILDRSGSMESKQSDVIGGYNRFLQDQKALPDPCRIFGTSFNTDFSIMQPIAPIQAAVELHRGNYIVGGSTALLDAFMHTVMQAEKEKQADERVLVLIITDGEENSSRETTYEKVAEMVKAKEALGDWTFTYLGVSLDKWHRQSGFSKGNIISYDAQNPKQSFARASDSASMYRSSPVGSTKNFYEANPGDQEPEKK